jgi:hypothetical protein
VAAQPWAQLTAGYPVGQRLQRVGHELVGKAEQKALSAAAGGGLDLCEDGQLRTGQHGTGRRDEPAHFD